MLLYFFFFFSSRRRHTRLQGDWSSDVCSSDLKFRSELLGHGRRLGRDRNGGRGNGGIAVLHGRVEQRRVRWRGGIGRGAGRGKGEISGGGGLLKKKKKKRRGG